MIGNKLRCAAQHVLCMSAQQIIQTPFEHITGH